VSPSPVFRRLGSNDVAFAVIVSAESVGFASDGTE